MSIDSTVNEDGLSDDLAADPRDNPEPTNRAGSEGVGDGKNDRETWLADKDLDCIKAVRCAVNEICSNEKPLKEIKKQAKRGIIS